MANKLYDQLNPNASGNVGRNVPQSPNASSMINGRKRPTAAELFREVQENGGDARKVFFKNAQEMGINPQDIQGIIDYLKRVIPNNNG